MIHSYQGSRRRQWYNHVRVRDEDNEEDEDDEEDNRHHHPKAKSDMGQNNIVVQSHSERLY